MHYDWVYETFTCSCCNKEMEHYLDLGMFIDETEAKKEWLRKYEGKKLCSNCYDDLEATYNRSNVINDQVNHGLYLIESEIVYNIVKKLKDKKIDITEEEVIKIMKNKLDNSWG